MKTLIPARNLSLFIILLLLVTAWHSHAAGRPNILWFVVDDMSANFSCYGETAIVTPVVDQLAREGTKFTSAFVTAPVCSPNRSAFITGMYQTSIGAHHHRSGRGELRIRLPEGMVPIPELFQAAGYYTCIGNGLPDGKNLGKTDYNFEWNKTMYDGPDWAARKPGQPFFMQVQMRGGKLRGGTNESAQRFQTRARKELGTITKPEDVGLPSYYPRDPVILADWAAYLDSVRMTDIQVGTVIERLKREGILDETLIIFLTDHGISHARGKQFLFNEGTHVPFVVRGPEIPKGAVRSDLIEHIDIAAISLAAAGIENPDSMQARNVFAEDYVPRTAVFAARDRCDETVEHLRSVRTDEFLYIKNYLWQRPHLQPNVYKDGKSIVIRLRELHNQGSLSPLQEELLFRPTRPHEELYAWREDWSNVKNLAGDSAYADTLKHLRGRLAEWERWTGDMGFESEAMYDSDMAVYVKGRSRNGKKHETTERNIRLMKQWAAQGK